MSSIATTRMSSKGQIVIPEKIRKELGLEPGSQFVVVAGKDSVILKPIVPPLMDDSDDLIEEARRQARLVGLTKADIDQAVADVRGRS